MDNLSRSASSFAEHYHFIVPLWGPKYVDMFVNHSLPSQMAGGNLPALPKGIVKYQIYTHPADADAIWQSSSVQKLRDFVDVSLVLFTAKEVETDYGTHSNPYHVNLRQMTWCYQQAMKAQRGKDVAFVFMTPDSVWADGAFRFMHECQCSGVRALMALGLITVRPTVQARLEEFRCPFDKDVIAIPPRKLVEVASDTLHPLGACRIVKDGGNRFSSSYYWAKPGKGTVAHSFYLHPVMVRPVVQIDRLPSTVDYRYVQLACPDIRQVRVVTDSDQLFYIDMAELRHVADALELKNFSRPEVLDWMNEWTDDYHRAYFRQPIILREADGGGNFQEELNEAETFADSLLREFREHQPRSGKQLHLTNIFSDPFEAKNTFLPMAESAAFAAPPESDVPVGNQEPLRLLRSLLGKGYALFRSLARRAVRRIYRRFLRKLYERIERLEALLEQEQKIRLNGPNVGFLLQKVEEEYKPHWIKTEYELRREIGLLRAELDEANEKRGESYGAPHLPDGQMARQDRSHQCR